MLFLSKVGWLKSGRARSVGRTIAGNFGLDASKVLESARAHSAVVLGRKTLGEGTSAPLRCAVSQTFCKGIRGCRKVVRRGHREGSRGCASSAPNTKEMVAVKPELSNTFLHKGQAIDKTGEKAIVDGFSGWKSLE